MLAEPAVGAPASIPPVQQAVTRFNDCGRNGMGCTGRSSRPRPGGDHVSRDSVTSPNERRRKWAEGVLAGAGGRRAGEHPGDRAGGDPPR